MTNRALAHWRSRLSRVVATAGLLDAQPATLDAAFGRFWSTKNSTDAQQQVDAILKSGVELRRVRMRPPATWPALHDPADRTGAAEQPDR